MFKKICKNFLKAMVCGSIFYLCFLCGEVFAESIVIEPESGVIQKNFVIENDVQASGGQCVYATQAANLSASRINDLVGEELTVKFHVNQTEKFYIWLRYIAPTTNADSVHYVIDQNFYTTHFSQNSGTWSWRSMLPLKLEAGEHSFKLYAREPLCKIDKIILTTNATFIPEGIGELPEKETELYDGENGEVLYSLPSVVPPKGEHPRLMIKKNEVPEIRESLTHETNAKPYNTIMGLAATECDGKLDQTGGVNYNTKYLSIIDAKAFMYLMTGKEQYGQEAKDAALNYARTMFFGTAPGMNAQRNAGHAAFVLSCVYDWCYDLFTEEQKAEFIELVEDRALSMIEDGYPLVSNTGNIHISSHATENPYLKDVMAFAIAVYDEKPSHYNINLGMLIEQFIPVKNFRAPGEFTTDGSTYGKYRIFCDLYCYTMLEKIGAEGLFDEKLLKIPQQFIYMERPDGNFIMDGDYAGGQFIPRAGVDYNPIFWMAGNMLKDGTLKDYYYKSTANHGYGSDGQSELSLSLYIILNDEYVPAKDYTSLPNTKYFGSPAGAMIARTGWNMGKDSDTVIAYMKMTEAFFGGHQHEDVGSFQLYYKGMLALDSGYYEHEAYLDENETLISGGAWGSAHDANYHKRTIAHNCMLIKDPATLNKDLGGQRILQDGITYTAKNMEELTGETCKTAEVIAYDYGPDMHEPEYSYLEGDIKYAYSDKVKEYTRAFMFLNLFDEEIPAALIVYDRIEAKDKSFEKSWMLHSIEEPEVDGTTTVIRRTAEGTGSRLVNETLLPADAEIEKIGGPGKEFYVNGKNYYARKSIGGEGGEWRIEAKPGTEREKDYFLNVMQVSDNDDAIKPLEVTYIELDKYLGIYLKDRAVFLKKDAGKQTKDFVVSVSGEGEKKFIVANLKEGVWTVFDKDNKLVTQDEVKGENGVLYFVANAGEYTLKWNWQEKIDVKNFDVNMTIKENEYTPIYLLYDKYYDNTSIMVNDTVMVSPQNIVGRMNMGECKTIGDKTTVSYEGRKIIYTVGNKVALLNGEQTELAETPVIYHDTIYVPLESMKPVIGFSCNVDTISKIASVEYRHHIEGIDDRIVNYPDADIAKIKAVEWQDSINDDLTGYNTVDGDISTNWSSRSYGAWVKWELDKQYTIDKIDAVWYLATQRFTPFAFFVSNDGNTWTKVYEGRNSGKTTGWEECVLKQPVCAKYVKCEVYWNSATDVSNLNEIKIHCVN